MKSGKRAPGKEGKKGAQDKKETKKKKKASKEIMLLSQGFIPKKTKIGSEFRGKNKVIICK